MLFYFGFSDKFIRNAEEWASTCGRRTMWCSPMGTGTTPADRVRLGHTTEISQLKLESIVGSDEFKAVYHLGQTLKTHQGVRLPLEELGQLTRQIIGGSTVRSTLPEDVENVAEIQVTVCNRIYAVGRELDIDFSQDITLYDDLAYHVRPAIYRMKNTIPQKNVLLDQIKRDYPTILAAVRRNIDTLEEGTM